MNIGALCHTHYFSVSTGSESPLYNWVMTIFYIVLCNCCTGVEKYVWPTRL